MMLLLYYVTLPMQAPDVSGLLVEMIAQGGRREATGQVRSRGEAQECVWGGGQGGVDPRAREVLALCLF